jgi:hypothetical protein
VAHPDVLRRLMQDRNYSTLGDFAGVILSERVLEAPTAVFKGINRPLHNLGVDNFVFIYVSKPAHAYRFCHKTKPADAFST